MGGKLSGLTRRSTSMGSMASTEQKDGPEEIERRRKRAEKRRRVVQELLETERGYVHRLKLLIEIYVEPLEHPDNSRLSSQQDRHTLFSNIITIHGFNTKFLEDLDDRFASFDNDTTLLGDKFLEFTPYFAMYQTYVNNHEAGTLCLTRMMKNSRFERFCEEARERSDGQSIQALLIEPIQRLPRYEIILRELVKYTEAEHPDIGNLNAALDKVREANGKINTRMKESEQRIACKTIESRFKDAVSLVLPHRRFIMEDEMGKVERSGKVKQTVFFLFSDSVVYGHGPIHRLKFGDELPIDRAFWVKDVINHDRYGTVAFEIHSSVKSFIVVCGDIDQKNRWLDSIREQIQAQLRSATTQYSTQEPELSAPLFVPDDFVDGCMVDGCRVKWSVFNRRHHCYYCGKLVCAKHSDYRLRHKMHSNQALRVCVDCFEVYKERFPVSAGVALYTEDVSDDDAKEE